jgi:2,3-bisphosphoglycerate-independent phosphoglycerate mutase
MNKTPITLVILDGWGHREQKTHNPIQQVDTPFIDHLFQEYPHMLLSASGEDVGLPPGQIGNSEVGHLHIGAGRQMLQSLSKINTAIESNAFHHNPALLEAIQQAKQHNSNVHIIGLLSPGGVHSHEQHIQALVEMLEQQGIDHHYLHAILDGRDVAPQSALQSIQQCPANIASIIGRFYAMDRDQRWNRVEAAYQLFTEGAADFQAESAESALKMAYDRGETDEFVKATIIDHHYAAIKDNDVVIFMNFRADRARQLTQAFTNRGFDHFKRRAINLSSFVTLTQYEPEATPENNHNKITVAFPPSSIKNNLGEFLAKQQRHQLRIAETEKYAHVTYFMNGGEETPFDKEDRILIPSPKVETYDLTPEMSALEITEKLITAIASGKYDVIICNYANPDMIGHTGIHAAAEQAIHVIDHCLEKVIQALKQVGGEALITADHGNIEIMFDDETGQPHTAHTTNLVPLIYVGRPAHFQKKTGALYDIAPTLLALLNEEPPKEMTGENLIIWDDV